MTDRKPSEEPQDFNGLFDMIRGLREDFAARRPRLEISKDAADRSTRDIRAAVLSVLATTPATGAGVIRAITERSTDDWEPAAAEVYPTLQLLVDEGLATVAEEEGRRTFTLTEAGEGEASAAGDDDEDADDWAGFFAPFRSFAENTPFAGGFAGARGELPKSGAKLAQAAHQVLLSGDEAQMEKVTALLDETRRKIYGILAEESAEETPENTGE